MIAGTQEAPTDMFAEIQFAKQDGRPALPPRQTLRVGDVSFAVTSASPDLIRVTPGLQPFACGSCWPDIDIKVAWTDRLSCGRAEKIFDSGAIWSLYRDASDYVFDCEVSALGSGPYKRMRISSDFRRAKVLLNRELLGAYPDVCALDYPTDELLITNYLACHGLGVEVHGCGLIDRDIGGCLFLGHSGAGKSTTARLWDSSRAPEILSDDRIILRLCDGELWMYGTPWHGEAAFALPGEAKLKRIFVLQHGAANVFVPLLKSRAVGELFARCFPPFHSSAALERTMDFLNRVVDTVPTFEFHFVPDASAVEAIVNFRGGQ